MNRVEHPQSRSPKWWLGDTDNAQWNDKQLHNPRANLDKGLLRSRDQWIEALLLVESFKLIPRSLDMGPRSRDQWIQALLLVKSFKLVPRSLDKGPRPKSGKLRLNLHGTCFGGKINQFGLENSAIRRAPDLKNQESGQGPRCSPIQGFNLLQMSPDWFLGNWTLDPCLKWA